MPDASEENHFCTRKAFGKSIFSNGNARQWKKTPEDILQELLGDMELAVLDRLAVSFKCGCSKERFCHEESQALKNQTFRK